MISMPPPEKEPLEALLENARDVLQYLLRLIRRLKCFMSMDGHDYKLEYDERNRVRLRCVKCGHTKNI